MRHLRLLALAALIALAGAACARGVTLNPDAGESAAVNVINQMSHPMVVSFDDGTRTQPLGTVPANRSDRFIVATQASTITVIATDEADTHTVRRTITLSPGQTVDVRLN